MSDETHTEQGQGTDQRLNQLSDRIDQLAQLFQLSLQQNQQPRTNVEQPLTSGHADATINPWASAEDESPPPPRRTTSRQQQRYSIFNVNDTRQQDLSANRGVLVREYLISPEEQLKSLTLAGVVWALNSYQKYKNTATDKSKRFQDFIAPAVLQAIFQSEKGKNTDLSAALPQWGDLYHIPAEKVLNAMARAVRPETKNEFYQVIMTSVRKHRLPLISEWRIDDTNYTLKPENFERSMFQSMATLIQTVCDSAEFLYREATGTDLLIRLPPVNLGKEKTPGLFRILLQVFGHYTKTVLLGIGDEITVGQFTTIEEFRLALNGFNERMVAKSVELESSQLALLPQKSISELNQEYDRKHAVQQKQRERTVARERDNLSVLQLDDLWDDEGDQHDLSRISLTSSYATARGEQQQREDEVSLSLVTTPQGKGSYRDKPPENQYCWEWVRSGQCKAGDQCAFKDHHTQQAVDLQVEKRVRVMLSSPVIGKARLEEQIRACSANPQPEGTTVARQQSQHQQYPERGGGGRGVSFQRGTPGRGSGGRSGGGYLRALEGENRDEGQGVAQDGGVFDPHIT